MEDGEAKVSYLVNPISDENVLGLEVLMEDFLPPEDLIPAEQLKEGLEDLWL